jgi:hypothetical protein
LVAFALTVVVPAAVGLLAFYVLIRRRMPAREARVAWRRFAVLWTPAAVAIAVAAELIWH